MAATVNAIGNCVDILDICPSKEEINKQINELSQDKDCNPIMMIAIDGAMAPIRLPTPYLRNEKQGPVKYSEVKGFRVYLLNSKKIIHLISWHQLCTAEELTENLFAIKNACLIPEEKVRLGIIGDGAEWIWNLGKKIFPAANMILDYYH